MTVLFTIFFTPFMNQSTWNGPNVIQHETVHPTVHPTAPSQRNKNKISHADTLPSVNTPVTSIHINLSSAEHIHIPGPNKNKTIYAINTIYLPYDQLLSIHVLGDTAWSTKDATLRNNIIKHWTKYINSTNIKLYCVLNVNEIETTFLVQKALERGCHILLYTQRRETINISMKKK
eukprot:927097_1